MEEELYEYINDLCNILAKIKEKTQTEMPEIDEKMQVAIEELSKKIELGKKTYIYIKSRNSTERALNDFEKIFKRSVTIEEIRSIGQQITPYISEEYELSKEQNDISAELRKYKAYNAIKNFEYEYHCDVARIKAVDEKTMQRIYALKEQYFKTEKVLDESRKALTVEPKGISQKVTSFFKRGFIRRKNDKMEQNQIALSNELKEMLSKMDEPVAFAKRDKNNMYQQVFYDKNSNPLYLIDQAYNYARELSIPDTRIKLTDFERLNLIGSSPEETIKTLEGRVFSSDEYSQLEGEAKLEEKIFGMSSEQIAKRITELKTRQERNRQAKNKLGTKCKEVTGTKYESFVGFRNDVVYRSYIEAKTIEELESMNNELENNQDAVNNIKQESQEFSKSKGTRKKQEEPEL